MGCALVKKWKFEQIVYELLKMYVVTQKSKNNEKYFFNFDWKLCKKIFLKTLIDFK